MSTLFVEADDPLLVFHSAGEAERYLEAEDVRNGAYPRGFGASGEQFEIRAYNDVVVISPSNAPPDPSGLEALLRRSLSAVGEPVSETASLAELVAAAEAYWAELDPYGERFSRPFPWWGCVLVLVGIAAAIALSLRVLNGS